MATTTIPWDDGSGDNIYLTYSSASGDQTVTVSSDANTGNARTQTVTFSAGSLSEVLTINQEGAIQQYTLSKNLSSYDTSDHQYSSLSNASRAYTSYDSTTYANMSLTTGSQAETWVYFKFDLSSIPANATIDSVSVTAKTSITTGSSGAVATRRWTLCSGTTAKSSNVTITNVSSSLIATVDGGTWTRAELDDARLKIYAKRGTSNTSNSYSIRLFGATITVTYTV